MKTKKENNAIKILNLLNDGEISKEELLHKLNIKQSTFYKHLKTIKLSGFNIKNIDGIYQIINYKNIINYSNSECSVFAYLYLIATNLLSKNKSKETKEAFIKMLRLSNQKNYDITKEKFELYKALFSSNISKKKINSTTQAIETNDENTIIKIKSTTDHKETIFELYDKLINSYRLREDERIIDKTKEKLVVASSNPNKNELFRRLLRYDIYCKVAFPIKHANQFKEMLEKSLANLDKFPDNNISLWI